MIDWFTPIYLLAIYGLVRLFVGSKDKDKPGDVNWTPLESLGVTLAIYFGSQVVGAVISYAVPLIAGMDKQQAIDWLENTVYGQFLFVALVEALAVYFLYWFLKRRKANFKTIGLKGNPAWRDLAYVLMGFVGYFIIFVLLATVAKQIIPGLNIDQKQDIGFKDPLAYQLPIVFMSLVLMPAFVEELLVRGFLFTGLRAKLPKYWAIFLASALFGIAHLQAGNGEKLLWIAAIDTFSLSLVLIYIKEKTGALWAPIGLHMLKNSVAFVVLFIAGRYF